MFGLNNEGFFITVAKIDKIYKKMCFQAVSEYRFTPNEIIVLMFLSNNAPLDTAKDIAHFRNISKGLVAKSVDSLCQKGFLAQAKDQKDRRLIHLRLTEKSRDITKRLHDCKSLFFSQLLHGVSAEYLNVLNHITAVMNENLEKMLVRKEHEEYKRSEGENR